MIGQAGKTQFQLIQALRGVAALWVVLFHIDKGHYLDNLTRDLPGLLNDVLFHYGSAGVAIFFVLSGFVISHSLAGQDFRGSDFLRFVARRSIRLDPPYWAAILLSIIVTAAFEGMHADPVTLPSPSTLLTHLFYVQRLADAPRINVAFWTLTFEIQFYLVLALAYWLRTTLVDRGVSPEKARLMLMVPLGALALLAAARLMDGAPHGLFVTLWHGFFLGVLAYEAGYLRRSPVPLLILAAVTLAGARGGEDTFGPAAALTAIGLCLAARTGYLVNGLRARPWQMLGMLSYSLYLVHVPAITIGFGIWGRLAGWAPVQEAVGLIVVLGFILAVAVVFWWLVERPSHKLAVALFRRDNPARQPVSESCVRQE